MKAIAQVSNCSTSPLNCQWHSTFFQQEKLDIADREAGRVRLPYPSVLGVDPRLKAEPSVSLPESLK